MELNGWEGDTFIQLVELCNYLYVCLLIQSILAFFLLCCHTTKT